MDIWCDGDSIRIGSSGLSQCFNSSVTTIIPPLYMIVCGSMIAARLRDTNSGSASLPAIELRVLRAFMLLSVTMAVVAVAYSACIGLTSPAMIVSVVLQCTAWMGCAALVWIESRRDLMWPSNALKFFTALEFVANCIVYLSSADRLLESSNAVLMVSICTGFFANLVLVLLGVFRIQDTRHSVQMTEFTTFTAGSPEHQHALSCWYPGFRSSYKRVNTHDREAPLLGEQKGHISALESRLSEGSSVHSWDAYTESNSASRSEDATPLSTALLKRLNAATLKVQRLFEFGQPGSVFQGLTDREADEDDSVLLPQGVQAPLYSTTVKRWELARTRARSTTPLSIEPSGDAIILSPEHSFTTVKSSSSLASLPGTPKRAAVDPESAEVLYEISIRCTPSAELEWEGRKYGREVRWSVWRSANDVIELHRSLAQWHGPNLPLRRPRLRTAQGSDVDAGAAEGQSVLQHEDIAVDMRAISAYLRSLLNHRKLHGHMLSDFLGVNKEGRSAHEEALQAQEQSDGTPIDSEFGVGRPQQQRGDENTPNPAVQNMLHEQQSRWKPTVVRLRRNLPERAIAVRLRTFAAVVSGHDIVQTLQGECTNREEAKKIAQELLSCDLLHPVSCGFAKPESEDEERPACNVFRETPGYLYSYPTREVYHSRALPRDGPDGLKWYRRDKLFSVELEVHIPEVLAAGSMDVQSSGSIVVLYHISVSHAEEEWSIRRRFSEFAQLDKRLLRAGLRPTVVLPAKAIFKLSNTALEARRAKLEEYLTATVQLASQNPGNIGPIVAVFLDPQFAQLRIVDGDGSFAVTDQLADDDEARLDDDELGNQASIVNVARENREMVDIMSNFGMG